LHQHLFRHFLRRFAGIGKAGIATLVPTADSLVKKRDSAKWDVINHVPFDSQFGDNFQGTSLHLSFTDYNQRLHTGIHGVRDAEIYFLEALVSVHDRGTWIGDLDVLGSIENQLCMTFERQIDCKHNPQVQGIRVIAVDNWDELIDNPDGIMIMRAKENWLARLAGTSLSVQRRHATVVLSHKNGICWTCIQSQHFLNSTKKVDIFIG
jgi:hypothetical protein